MNDNPKKTCEGCYIQPVDWQKVVDAELDEMAPERRDRLIGLALSGGGIRSASFSLGALQALVAAGRLKQIDYMSTVSGGGYIGSALTWFTNYVGKDGKKPRFGVTDADFPLGAKQAAALRPAPKHDRKRAASDEDEEARIKETEFNQRRINRLDHLRQHGNYLKPGTMFEFISMIWMIIQSMLLPLIVYFCVLFLPFATIAYGVHIILPDLLPLNLPLWLNKLLPLNLPMLSWAVLLGSVVTALMIVGLPLFFILVQLVNGKNGNRIDFLEMQYRLRKLERTKSGPVVLLILLLFILGLLPFFNDKWEYLALVLGTGLVATLGQLLMQIRSVRLFGGRSGGILVTVACGSLVLGLLMLAYGAVEQLFGWYDDATGCENILRLASFVILSALIGFVIGWFQNINLFGLHRLYRDRLMETFLPDFWQDDEQTGPSEPARDANTAFLSTMYKQGNGPYHIINANIVLTGSKIPRYRGRGGTNFILSPLFSGSDATGWRRSNNWKMHAGCMTLPTAMAISGAAINPRTGSIDRSPLRQPLLSFLMSLTNLRLGLWALNPRVEQDCKCSRKENLPGDMKELPKKYTRPNFLIPGMTQGLWPRRHSENRSFIELTDGAHFDNTGLYELIRRQVKLIIMVDGTADKDTNYESLANALERIRVDFGVQIRFEEAKHDLEGLLPDPDNKSAFVQKYQLAERGFAIARIDYQPHDDVVPHRQAARGSEDGTLILIKSTMVKSLPADVLGYKSTNKDFPNESTADQFFDEVQLEAYRELGYRITKDALDDFRVKREFNR